VSDWFYQLVKIVGTPAFLVSASPVILHADRAARKGAYILASTHFSPYDVSCLIKDTPRHLDFVSIVEMFRIPWVKWFFGNMNAMPLDRGRVDTVTTRTILDRLAKGRAVAMFPEGRVQDDAGSVLNGGKIRPGVFGLAQKANAPIIPCVILGTRAYHERIHWAPLRRTVYGINYGNPIFPSEQWNDIAFAEKELRDAFHTLHVELLEALKGRRVM